MNQEPANPTVSIPAFTASGSAVHSALRFLWLLRRRKPVVLAALTGVLLLGALHFATATRIYESTAQVLVRHSESNAESVSLSSDRNTQDQMATFQRLFTSTHILHGAINRLTRIPPELAEATTREEAVEELRKTVSASTLRGTSIIDVSGRSSNPDAAYEIVDALVTSYINYIDENHKSVTADVLEVLVRQQQSLERDLTTKEHELLIAKQQTADLGITDGAKHVHPIVQSAVALNEELDKARQRRIELQAASLAVRQAIQNGGDLRQHLVALEPLVGKEILLDAVGINSFDIKAIQDAQQQVLKLNGELQNLRLHYGDEHPRVKAVRFSIADQEKYLRSVAQGMELKRNGQDHQKLGTMVSRMIEQDLVRTQMLEQQLTQEAEIAEREAMQLSGQLAMVEMIRREVDRLRENHTKLLNKIEKIDISKHYSDVQAAPVSPPVLPKKPIHPRLIQILLLSLVLGIATGGAIVYVMDAIDDRFRSPEELQEQLGVKVLAMIRRHGPAAGSGIETLQVFRSPDAAESEAFRTLRTTLAFSGRECNRLVVTSSEPSDGKTTVLSNLGVSYAQSGRRTILIDCDLRKPGLTNLFSKRGLEGVSEILRGKQDVDSMCRERLHQTGLAGLDMIPSGRRPADSADLLGRERFMDLIAWAESEYDQVLIDSPPILAAADAAIAARQVDGVILVVHPQRNHRRLVLRAYEGLAALGANVLGVVVNSISDNDESSYYGYGYGYGYGHGYGNENKDDHLEAEDRMEQGEPVSIRIRGHAPSPSEQESARVEPQRGQQCEDDIQESLARIARSARRSA